MKKKLFVFTFVPTHPQDMGCRNRIYQLLNGFKKAGCSIDMIYFPMEDPKIERPRIEQMRAYWDKVTVIEEDKCDDTSLLKLYYHLNAFLRVTDRKLGDLGLFVKRTSPILHKILTPFSNKLQLITRKEIKQSKIKKKERPLEREYNKETDFYFKPRIWNAVKKYSQRNKPDIFICEYTFFSYLCELFGEKTLKLIDTHDSLVDFFGIHDKIINLTYKPKMNENIERRMLEKADIIIAIQEKEEEYFKKLVGAKRTITIGHQVELKKNNLRKKRNTLLFVGSAWKPNEEGIQWFLKEVWPLIRKRRPTTQLIIAGKVSSIIPRKKGVIRRGLVDDLTATYEEADLVINPIHTGTGLKIKAIEALGQRRPVIATSHVIKGFNGKTKGMIEVNEPKEMAKNIIKLLQDNTMYEKLSNEALRFAKTYNKKQQERILTLTKKRSKRK